MTDEKKSWIKNRNFASQLKDFSGLRFGKIMPTDIDGFVDFGNKVFVFFEIKHGGSKMPYGQKLGYARLADACEKSGIYTLVIVANHEIFAPNDIDISILPVTEIRFQKKWRPPNVPITVRGAIDGFISWVDMKTKKESG